MCWKAVLFNTVSVYGITIENIYCNKRDTAGPVKLAFHNEHIYQG